MDDSKSYLYEGPITLHEGIQMESGDELHLGGPEDWAEAEHLCDALCRRLGLASDGATINVRISVEAIA